MKSPFLCSIRDTIRARHYSIKTEETYLYLIKYYIRYHKMKHPSEMGEGEICEFLDFLALNRNLAASTQKVALNALVFMYRHVLGTEPGDFSRYHRATTPDPRLTRACKAACCAHAQRITELNVASAKSCISFCRPDGWPGAASNGNCAIESI